MDVRYTAFPLDVCSERNSWFRWIASSGNTALNALLHFMPFAFCHPIYVWFPFYWGCESRIWKVMKVWPLLGMPDSGIWTPKYTVADARFRRQLACEHEDICNTFGNRGFISWLTGWPLTRPLLFLQKVKSKPGFSRMTSLFLHIFHALFTGLVFCRISNYCSDVGELVPGSQQPSNPRETALSVAG